MTVDLRHGRSEEQKRRMQQAYDDGLCPFCEEHIGKIHGLPIEYADHWMVTDNAFPYDGTAIHKLFIYRPRHITRLEEIDAAAWTELHALIGQYAAGIGGGAVFTRFGDTGKTGSSIAHLHIHLLSGTASADDPAEERGSLHVRLGYKKIEKSPGA